MTIADVAAVPLSDFDHRAQLRRAVIASTVGTTIEWYDFLLYGQMAALVFAKLYFPSSDPLTGVLQAFAVFAVGFVARPIGFRRCAVSGGRSLRRESGKGHFATSQSAARCMPRPDRSSS